MSFDELEEPQSSDSAWSVAAEHFKSPKRLIDEFFPPGYQGVTGGIGITRNLTNTFVELRQSIKKNMSPRRSWIKRLIAVNDQAGMKKMMNLKGRVDYRAAGCSVCENPFRHAANRMICSVCHLTICERCISQIRTIHNTSAKMDACCLDCIAFIEEYTWRCQVRGLSSEDQIVVEVFNDTSNLHTLLWKDSSQLDGLVRLASRESPETLPNELSAILGEVCDSMAMYLEILKKLWEACRIMLSETVTRRRLVAGLTQYLVLIVHKHKIFLSNAQRKVRAVKRSSALFLTEADKVTTFKSIHARTGLQLFSKVANDTTRGLTVGPSQNILISSGRGQNESLSKMMKLSQPLNHSVQYLSQSTKQHEDTLNKQISLQQASPLPVSKIDTKDEGHHALANTQHHSKLSTNTVSVPSPKTFDEREIQASRRRCLIADAAGSESKPNTPKIKNYPPGGY